MKIGIITFHAAPNYGAVLQGYALQKYLEQLGHDARFIDYRPPYLTTGGSYHFPRSTWHIKANLVISYQKLMALKGVLSPTMQDQKRRFAEFVEEHLVLWPKRYKSIKELWETPPELDAYICGSDQIWNPSQQYGFDPACFLDFGPSRIRRVSYASSFGTTDIKERSYGEVAQLSSKLDAISIREKSGCQLFEKLTGRSSVLVPDPTFLIDWSGLFKKTSGSCSRGKIFSYVLRSGEGLYDLQKNLSEGLGLKVVQPLNPHQRWKCFGKVSALGPMEWLSAIENSEAVITNSFHGTLFSILFNKPFLSVKLGGAKAGLNARASHLLKSLNLEKRQIFLEDDEGAIDLMAQPIDWENVNEKVQEMRLNGQNFLKQALAK